MLGCGVGGRKDGLGKLPQREGSATTKALQVVSRSKANAEEKLHALRNEVMLGDVEINKLKLELREVDESVPAKTALNEASRQELEAQ